jgi:hypothetical protein
MTYTGSGRWFGGGTACEGWAREVMLMPTVQMILTDSATRILVSDPSGRAMLKAELSAARHAHKLAARTLFEGVALYCNARLHVVLSAESEELSFVQGLSDGLGYGDDTLHDEVEILNDRRAATRAPRRRPSLPIVTSTIGPAPSARRN